MSFYFRKCDRNSTMTDTPTVLWQPSAERKAAANLTRFIAHVNYSWGAGCTDHPSLYEWSIREPVQFWRSVWAFCGVIGEMGAEPYLENGTQMPGARWFPNARLNFAENLLRRRDTQTALVFWGEDIVRRKMSYAELYDLVSRTAQALRVLGVAQGDRVAGFMPNMPETIVAMLAATSIGAIWSSCSTDFGVQGVLDRFGQIQPKALFCVDGYYYGGKAHDVRARIQEIARQLPSVEVVVAVPYLTPRPAIDAIPNATHFVGLVAAYRPGHLAFPRLPFDHPLYLLYSSGPTPVP